MQPPDKSPVVTDGELIAAASGGIAGYLTDRYGGGYLRAAPGTPERRCRNYWLRYAEGSAMPPLLLKLFQRVASAPAPCCTWTLKPPTAGLPRAGTAGPTAPHARRRCCHAWRCTVANPLSAGGSTPGPRHLRRVHCHEP